MGGVILLIRVKIPKEEEVNNGRDGLLGANFEDF